jgi:hypothetical protein
MERSYALGFLTLTVLLGACGDATPPPKAPSRPSYVPSGPGRKELPVLAPVAYAHSGQSYDEALAVPEELDAVKSEPELSDADLSKPMQNSEFLSTCGAPDSMKVVVKVAVREGRAMGVTVATSPEDPAVAACVDKAVRELSWPTSKKRFSMTTAY